MGKRFFASLILSFLLIPQSLAFSLPDEARGVLVDLAEETAIDPSLSANSSVQVNKSIIFDASGSTAEAEGNLSFEWFFGDGNRQQGEEVVHSYAEPGEYEVTLLIRDADGNQSSLIHDVFVFEKSFVLLTNVADEQERLDGFVDSARNEFVFIETIEAYTSKSEFLEEEELKRKILENISSLESAETILIWTNGSSGLTVLSQFQSTLDEDFFSTKDIIFVSDADFGSLSNIARGVYQSIVPNQIILTRSESIWVLLDAIDSKDFVNILKDRGVQYQVVNDELHLRPWNIMSYFVNTMIDRGIPTNTIRLVLMLSVIVTVVSFMKQVVGLATLGVYTPSILALSFIALDLSFGLIILLTILFIGTLTRLFLRRYRLLYIPRMAIVMVVVSLTILFLLFLGAYFDVANVVTIAVFPMLIMSTMVEKFVSIQSGKGLRSALTLVGEAVLVAILCYYVAEWEFLKVVIMGHPEVIFIFLLINVFLARWSGLRLMEYVRFREIIRYAEE